MGAGGRWFKSSRPDHFTLVYFVYVLKSVRTSRFYVGQCDHLIERFHEHQRGANLATRGRGPWLVAYFEIYGTRREALMREAEIKRKKSSASIRKMIAGVYQTCGIDPTDFDESVPSASAPREGRWVKSSRPDHFQSFRLPYPTTRG